MKKSNIKEEFLFCSVQKISDEVRNTEIIRIEHIEYFKMEDDNKIRFYMHSRDKNTYFIYQNERSRNLDFVRICRLLLIKLPDWDLFKNSEFEESNPDTVFPNK